MTKLARMEGKESIEYKVKNFISTYWLYDINKITKEKSLDDLGMFGDDKEEFIIDFAKSFNLSVESFAFEEYIDDEVFDLFGLGNFIKKNVFKQKVRKVYLIYISMLVDWVKSGRFN